MKLYTEEQVREILKSTHIHTDNDVDMILPQFTPIELPSDEKIDNVALDFAKKYRATTYEISALIIGAKWMKEQILNQTNNMAQQTYGEWMRSNPPIPTLTAVEWLEEQLNKWSDGRIYLPPHLFEKAKEMEKEQIVNAFEIGWKDEDRIGEEYYNEVYGGQGSPDTKTSQSS